MRREIFGEPHPDIATSLNSVGYWYGEQRDWERALRHSQQALAMYRQLFGEVHPNIATSLNNVGAWYSQQGELKRAYDYFLQSLSLRRKLFGERHPDIATSLFNIGAVYRKEGDVPRGLEHYQQALTIYREFLGEGHPSTIKTAREVSINLIRLNRRNEAYDLVRHFVVLAQGPIKDQLKALEAQLLSKPIRPGFRQPPKSGKRKNKKKRK